MNAKRLGNIPHNTQVFFTDAEFEVARIIYVNQQRVAKDAAYRAQPDYLSHVPEDC